MAVSWLTGTVRFRCRKLFSFTNISTTDSFSGSGGSCSPASTFSTRSHAGMPCACCQSLWVHVWINRAVSGRRGSCCHPSPLRLTIFQLPLLRTFLSPQRKEWAHILILWEQMWGTKRNGGYFLYMLSTSTLGPAEIIAITLSFKRRGSSLPILHLSKALGSFMEPSSAQQLTFKQDFTLSGIPLFPVP